jgi:hypothetical protein
LILRGRRGGEIENKERERELVRAKKRGALHHRTNKQTDSTKQQIEQRQANILRRGTERLQTDQDGESGRMEGMQDVIKK